MLKLPNNLSSASEIGFKLPSLFLLTFQIVLGDCVKSLNEMIANGTKVDYVFGDLTDIPVSPEPEGESWDFIRLILNTSFQVLKPDGKYMTHVSLMTLAHNMLTFRCKNIHFSLDNLDSLSNQ